MDLFFTITTLPKISLEDVLHVSKFWPNFIRAHNMKTRKSIYQDGTALKGVNDVDSSNVTSHVIPACMKELRLFLVYVWSKTQITHSFTVFEFS
jgi:hypothetical protein